MSEKIKLPSTKLPDGIVRLIPDDSKRVKNGGNNLPTFLNPPPPPPPSSTSPENSK